MYIAPFVHELKAFFDELYDDGGANLVLCHEIQQYYKKHSYPTKVKAAGLLSVDEAKALAGVSSVTVAPDLLRTLDRTPATGNDIEKSSLFRQGTVVDEGLLARKTYVKDEQGWRDAFARSYGGKGEWKTHEVD